jgi:hypothetical protein
MPLQDFLKQLGLSMLQGGGQALGNAMQAQGNPLAFQEGQENQRQRAQFGQQMLLHQTPMPITPYQQQELALRQQEFEASQKYQGQQSDIQEAARKGQNNQWLALQRANGLVEDAHPSDPDALEIGGHFVRPTKPQTLQVPEQLQGLFGTNTTVSLTKDNAPLIDKLFGQYEANQKQTGKKPLDPSLLRGWGQQLDTLFPTSGGPKNQQYNQQYKEQLGNLFQAGDETGIRSMMSKLTDADREWDQKYGSKTQTAEAALAGLKKSAEDKADFQATANNLPDETLEYWRKQIKLGATNYGDVLSRFDKAGKERFANYVASKGEDQPVPLDNPSKQHLAAIEPVMDSLKKLKAGIARYANSNSPMPLTGKRLMYSLGIGDPDGSGGLISMGEMDRIRGAAQSLTGLRTNLATLTQAQIHTPNFWVDSGKLMNDKVDNMLSYLQNQEEKIYKFGAKTGIVQGAPSSADDQKLLDAIRNMPKR